MKTNLLVLGAAGLIAFSNPSNAADVELAKQISNPLASLISLPLQLNQDTNVGARDGKRTTLNIQPVISFSLGPDLNLITRTIIPYKWRVIVKSGV